MTRHAERSVLIVTPHFAPETHAAVFRAHKLAKYLPDYGWKPYVLTVDTNYVYNEDPGLLEELPDEVEIVRARYIEPTLRGLRMALGGEERTYAALKPSIPMPSGGVATAVDSHPRVGGLGAVAERVYGYARRRWLNVPDRYRTWERSAIRVGRELLREHHIPIVYSTCLPYTTLRIGMDLQSHGAKWVADFRDPVTYGLRFSSHVAAVRTLQRGIVRDALARADRVTALSSSYNLIFHDLYGPISKPAIMFIPTGVDDALVPAHSSVEEVDTEPYVVFVGEIMPDSGPEFFSIFSSAIGRLQTRHRILVIGHEMLNRERLAPVLACNQLADSVHFIDHLPQRELYELIQRAAAGVLAPGPRSQWWTNHAKLVDYVGLRKPVLAVVPDPSEARSVLTRARLGVFLDGEHDEAVATLVRFLNGDLDLPEPNAAECDRYLASTQVRSFAELFDSLIER